MTTSANWSGLSDLLMMSASLVYALTLVLFAGARAAATASGRSTAAPELVLALAGYGTLIVNFVVVNVWFSGLHSYAGPEPAASWRRT